MTREEEDFLGRVGLVAAMDHSGRAGNGFFLTIFDRHPQVLTCPWIHYTYSYLVHLFRGEREIDSERVLAEWPKRSYFRFAHEDMTPDLAKRLSAFGGDPGAPVDRPKVRDTFARLVSAKPRVTTREIIAYTYMAYAAGVGRDLSSVRWILVSDAVSLRTENPLSGFSGRVADWMHEDFPGARIVSLVRDPRANFCSCRHQFVNANGNMYGLRPGNAAARLRALAAVDLTPDDCAFLYWMLYFAAAARTILDIKDRAGDRFLHVRNEDLNLRFAPTIASVCAWLGVAEAAEWSRPDYVPTMAGRPWRGTGAFNSRYQPRVHGLLKNDSDEMAAKAIGPNAIVTERWKSRLAPHEVRILEHLFREECEHFGYAPMRPAGPYGAASLVRDVLRPFLGELPTLGWIAEGRHEGAAEVGRRAFYALAFPPYYLAARLQLLRLALGRAFFGLRRARGAASAPWKAAA